MHGEGEDVRVVGEDCCCPVPVVYVEVDDNGAANQLLPVKHADGNRDVVDETKAFAVVGKSVMKPAAEMDGDAFL